MIASAGEKSGKQANLLREYEAVLSYEAPFLIEKLLKERIVGTQEEGEALFAEVKKYLVMCQAAPDVLWNVYSARVDKVWHEFVLFTRDTRCFVNDCLADTFTTARAMPQHPRARRAAVIESRHFLCFNLSTNRCSGCRCQIRGSTSAM